LKIVIPSVRDTGGTAYTLAHAINSASNHQAIDLTAQKSYINYPTMAHMGDYTKKTCRKLIYQADVVVFLGSFRPLYEGLKLSARRMKPKKKLLIFMGTEWRSARHIILRHIDEYVKANYKIVVGSPCMMMPGTDEAKTPCPKDVGWLPVVRSFDEIRDTYGMCNQDAAAVQAFGVPKDKIYFMHAPTSEEKKGSQTFYYAMTRAQQLVPNLIYSSVRGQPWINCLKSLAVSDLLFDQDPPFPETYGAISVEASIFKLPVISRVDPFAVDFWKREVGLDSPIIQWIDDEDLFKKVYRLATDAELRRTFGESTYKFMRAIHDEKPVVERFFKMVDEMS